MAQPRRIGAALLALMIASPGATLAQSKAGIVTNLEGNVVAARAPIPQPVTLKFKDDVYQNDRITTGDSSLARLLLGGKAVVTVRERSVVTITEVPGKSTIQLLTGKIGLAVAKERMAAGESIEVKTPNAVCAVRGTVIVAEVQRTTAQAGGATPGIVTSFWVLRGTVDAYQLIPGTNTPAGNTFQVNTLQGFTAAGSAPPTVGNVPTGQLGQITSGLTPTMPQQGGGQDQIVADQLQTAVALTQVLNPVSPPPPLGNNNLNLCAGTTCSGNTGGPPIDLGPATVIFPSGTFDKTLFTLSGDTILPTGPGPLFLVPSTGDITLTGDAHLLDAINGVINPASVANVTLLKIDGTVTTSATSSSGVGLLNIDPTFVNAATIVDVAAGGTLNLAGSILKDVDGTYNVTADFLKVSGTVQPAAATPGAPSEGLIFIGSNVTVGGNLVSIPGGQMTLNGLLLETASSALRGTTLNVGGALLDIGADGTLTSNSGLPPGSGGPARVVGALMANLGGTTLNAAAIANVTGTLNLTAGALLIDVGRVSEDPTVVIRDAFIKVNGGGQVLASGLFPGLLQLDGTNAVAGGIVRLQDSALLEASSPVLRLINGATVSVGGDAIRVATSQHLTAGVSAPVDVFSLTGSRLTLTAGSLASVSNGTFTIFGNLFSLNNGSTLTIRNGALVNVSGNGLFSLSNGSLGVFGATGANTLNVLATSGGGTLVTNIPNLSGVPVLLQNGAQASQVTASSGFVPFSGVGGSNTVNVQGGAAVLVVNGTGAKIKLGP